MSYAIISLGGKQYRVQEGQRLLVDRIALDDGATFTPSVLLVGGNGDTQIAPAGVTVTARVLAQERGPKLRIGKYKKRTGYRRHTGFRASLTQIEIESIGAAKRARASAKPEPAPEREPATQAPPEPVQSKGLPAGYDELTVAQLKDAASSWDASALTAALVYEQSHGRRKGAIAALEAALVEEKES
jgi:large subunit ribosomal protein L21